MSNSKWAVRLCEVPCAIDLNRGKGSLPVWTFGSIDALGVLLDVGSGEKAVKRFVEDPGSVKDLNACEIRVFVSANVAKPLDRKEKVG
ncbi:hypothetical protein ACI3EY_15640, partial [Ornithinimicrobium sp. LYQ92]|uniref:hypothetical protein n=1 Tax=Serinicoccus sp. LYQ92 TaxID=3378798 RepID=UPI00385455CB